MSILLLIELLQKIIYSQLITISKNAEIEPILKAGSCVQTQPLGKGSGMGLYLTQKRVDQHSGSIRVDTSIGKTQFTIVLPIQNAL